jgi:hypothetical protein
VYATRHTEGIKVFREAHIKTEQQQSSLRAMTKQKQQVEQTGQPGLFDPAVPMAPDPRDGYFEAERAAARAMMIELAPRQPGLLTYGDAWPQVLAKHAVTYVQLNKIASELRNEGALVFADWATNKRVPDDTYSFSRAS